MIQLKSIYPHRTSTHKHHMAHHNPHYLVPPIKFKEDELGSKPEKKTPKLQGLQIIKKLGLHTRFANLA